MKIKKKCKYDKIPSQRYLDIFEENSIEVSLEPDKWEVYFPTTDKLKEIELASLENLKDKYIGLVTGTNCMIDRRIVWMNLEKSFGRQEASLIMPETFVLDKKKDIRLLRTDTRVHFILKDNRHRRLGLLLTETVENVLKEKEAYDIVQPLITNLLRYKGTSVNIRVYLLLTLKEDKLTAYLYQDGVCVYGKPPENGIALFDRMITHSRNLVPEEFPELMSQLLEELEINRDSFFSMISEKINSLIDSAAHEFGKLENLSEAVCFQVFGVDILLDGKGNPLICEVNKGPSMKSKNENHGDLKNDMIEEMLSVVGLRNVENVGFTKISTRELIN